jgi:putative ABC transport system permease protein
MTFRKGEGTDPIRVVINQAFADRVLLNGQKDVLNEKMRFWWGPQERLAEIIGVVANHHQESLKQKVSPIMYIQPAWPGWKYFSIRTDMLNVEHTIASIEGAFLKAFPDNTFSYFFLDDFFNRQYEADQRFEKIFNVFTSLAIGVTCLGLLGLSIFSVAQRIKEMAIRKVSGAPVHSILFLFSKDFVTLLFIAYIVAAPVIYMVGMEWLENFSSRVSLGWQAFVIPPLILIIITMITIGATAIRAAIETPVKALRQ